MSFSDNLPFGVNDTRPGHVSYPRTSKPQSPAGMAPETRLQLLSGLEVHGYRRGDVGPREIKFSVFFSIQDLVSDRGSLLRVSDKQRPIAL